MSGNGSNGSKGGNGSQPRARRLRWLPWLLALPVLPVLAQRPARTAGPPPSTRLYLAALDAGPVAAGSGQLLGLVTDGSGHAMAGAVVEVRGEGLHQAPQRQRTAGDGLFRLDGLAPGSYYVQVAWAGRVAPRQRVLVHASERALLLVDLPRLLQEVQFGAPPGTDSEQAFTWALRQASIWRPVLRWDEDANLAAHGPEATQGFVALTAGGSGSAFAAPDLATEFRVDTRAWDGELLSLRGEVGTSPAGAAAAGGGAVGGGSDTRVEAEFRSADPSNQGRLRLGVRQIGLPGLPALPSLRVFSANYANTLDLSNLLGDGAHLQFGSMLNAVSMTDTVATLDPYMRAVIPMTAESQLEFRAASAVPPLRFDNQFAEMQNPAPQVTVDHNRARLEHAHHQEVRYADSLTPATSVSAAIFSESFTRTAVNGAFGGTFGAAAANRTEAAAGLGLMPDLFNNMFVADGGDYGGWGYRVVLEHQLGESWRADAAYATGPALVPVTSAWGGGSGSNGLAASVGPRRLSAITLKLSGKTPFTATSIVCSYRALSRAAATGLDLYDDTSAASDSYANVYLRQPLPRLFGSGSSRIAALLEIHNLLAQGYIPMVSRDGNTLYLVQNARAVRGGLTISF